MVSMIGAAETIAVIATLELSQRKDMHTTGKCSQ